MNSSSDPPIYYLKDLKDDPVPGHFYRQQLRLAPDPKEVLYEIEKTLKKRTRGGKKEEFVKWLFYPDKFNEWTDQKNIVHGSDSKPKKRKKRRT